MYPKEAKYAYACAGILFAGIVLVQVGSYVPTFVYSFTIQNPNLP
jgi:hypothetical protein